MRGIPRITRIPMTLREYVQRNLNWPLLIFKVLMRCPRVEVETPGRAAAPDEPETRPLVSASAASIMSRSLRRSTSTLKGADALTRDAGGGFSLESHISSTEKKSPELRITDLSMTFCNSRMLPGQA